MYALQPPRILVVDDKPAVRELILRALQGAGYEVVAVRDGEAGLDAAKSAGRPYDLVLTNSYMPTMSGEQLIGHLRQLFPTSRFCIWTTFPSLSDQTPTRYLHSTSRSKLQFCWKRSRWR